MVNVNDEFGIFYIFLLQKNDWKHLENSKIGLENNWIFFQKVGTLHCITNWQ